MEHSPFILVNHEIRQIYDPVGDQQSVMDGLETGANYCLKASEFLQESANLSKYLEWLSHARQPALLEGFKRCVHRHNAHLLMLGLICQEDIAMHPPSWLSLRSALLTEVSLFRQKLSPSAGENIIH
jgi:hypothetical protein